MYLRLHMELVLHMTNKLTEQIQGNIDLKDYVNYKLASDFDEICDMVDALLLLSIDLIDQHFVTSLLYTNAIPEMPLSHYQALYDLLILEDDVIIHCSQSSVVSIWIMTSYSIS